MRYLVVTGGVISGIGKGTLASSAGLLLKTLGLRVTAIKIDPYMNIDAGTMSPIEHGEVFVMDDGGESDLDCGNYERYLDVTLGRDNNITTGKMYQSVIERERRGDYLGKTVQVIPHVTDAIQNWIERVSKQAVDETHGEADVCIIELGGTVGDIESMPFIEALRQFQFRVGVENFALIHVSLVPLIHGEPKTKPTQSSVRELRSLGLVPDLIATRCQAPLDDPTISKISMFCHVGQEQVLGVHDVTSVYHVPLLLEEQGLLRFLQKRLHLDNITVDPLHAKNGEELGKRWRDLTAGYDRTHEEVRIALVGKYTVLKDSYLSVTKALEHSSFKCGRRLKLDWIDSEHLEPTQQNTDEYNDAFKRLTQSHGILVPGGFGVRGTEGMIVAAQWARENKKPFLGICLGFQMAVVEYVRNVCGVKDAQSGELHPDAKNPVIIYMPELSKTHMGGTMRLGLRKTVFKPNTEWSAIRKLYGNNSTIEERHRHRYEVNPDWVQKVEDHGFIFTGRDESGQRMQVAELQGHPYFVGMQAHPEFRSRPLNPSPAFLGFVAASCGQLETVISAQAGYKPPPSTLEKQQQMTNGVSVQ